MADEKTFGLVIRTTDWSETSRIVTLWTHDFGKVRALAKGGRRLKSNFEVALDLLMVCEVVFLRKGTDTLNLLIEARIRERFPNLRNDLANFYAGCYVADLLDEGTEEFDPHPGLLQAALTTLRQLGSGPDWRALILAFEWCWLRETGHAPRIADCVECSAPLDPSRPIPFSALAGGTLCRSCAPKHRDRRTLSPAAWQALVMLENTVAYGPGLPPANTFRELRAMMGLTISTILGRRPRMLDWIETGQWGDEGNCHRPMGG